MSVLVHRVRPSRQSRVPVTDRGRRPVFEPSPAALRNTHRRRDEVRRPPTRARVVADYTRALPATCAPGRHDAVRWPLLVALAVGSALLVVTLGLFAGGMARVDAPVPEQTTLVSVGAGETLSELAVRYAPASDTAEVVDRIRSLNGLESAAVPAGLPLAVPYEPGLAPVSP